jgi:hypothetical protein
MCIRQIRAGADGHERIGPFRNGGMIGCNPEENPKLRSDRVQEMLSA